MATGRLGYASGGLTTTTLTNVYTVPTGYYAVFNISVTNTASTTASVRIALSSSATSGGINSGEYIEYGTTIVGNGVFERTGLVANAGMTVWIYTTGATGAVNATVYGIETSTT